MERLAVARAGRAVVEALAVARLVDLRAAVVGVRGADRMVGEAADRMLRVAVVAGPALHRLDRVEGLLLVAAVAGRTGTRVGEDC